MSRGRDMPTQRAIRAHWSMPGKRPCIWRRKGFASPAALMAPACFACRMPAAGFERSHIKARCDGGSDAPANLHMLCPTCHRDSEFKSGRRYWDWFWERTGEDMLLSMACRAGLNVATILRTYPENGMRMIATVYAVMRAGDDKAWELAPARAKVFEVLGLDAPAADA